MIYRDRARDPVPFGGGSVTEQGCVTSHCAYMDRVLQTAKAIYTGRPRPQTM